MTFEDGAARPVVGWFVVYPSFDRKRAERLVELVQADPYLGKTNVVDFPRHTHKSIRVEWTISFPGPLLSFAERQADSQARTTANRNMRRRQRNGRQKK